MPNLGPAELVIIAVVIMLLFGAKKMPDAARALGRSMRIFKSETKGMRADDNDEDEDQQHKTTQQQRPAQPSEPQQLPPASDSSTVNGQPVTETERTHESR